MKAFILMKVEPGKVKQAVKQISEMPNVKEVYAITGPDDLICTVEAEDAKSISDLVIADLHNVEGLAGTDTRIVVEL